jgi:hypothetical protein
LYIDVGGGSTELILLSKGKLVDKWSFNIGTLRMTLGKVKEKHWKELDVWVDHFKGKYHAVVRHWFRRKYQHHSKAFCETQRTGSVFSDLQKTFDALNGMTIRRTYFEIRFPT